VNSETPVMLSKTAQAYLSALTYRPAAERRTCYFPASGIYWEDEIPDLQELMKLPEDGLLQILRLFPIRYGIWEGAPLTEDEQQLWNAARSQLPDCPLFQRVELSPDDQLAQDAAVRTGTEITKAVFADADQLRVVEKCPGVQEISATFDLTKRSNLTSPPTVRIKPRWARILDRILRRRQARLHDVRPLPPG
jgi:hypothetical protein